MNDAGEVVGAENGVGGVVDNAAEELPEAHEGAEEGAKGTVSPENVAAIARDGSGELGGDEGLRDAPNEREDKKTEEGQ